MYYKILEKAFQQDELSVNRRTIDLLDNFIREQKKLGFKYLNPYKFSDLNNISFENSLQLFLFFTDENKLFKPQFFVDCPYCVGEIMHIHNSVDYLYCEECRREYILEYLKEKLYVMFVLNDEIVLPKVRKKYSKHNPYSTADILQDSPDFLKKDYPLSSESRDEDKGINKYPSYSEVKSANQLNGHSVSKSMINLSERIFSEGDF